MTVEGVIRAPLKWLAGVWGTRFVRHPRPEGRRVVLCYHSVHPSGRLASVAPGLFGEHLDYLQQHCAVVPLAEITRSVPADEGRPRVAVTFDDGYLDNYLYALPLLAQRGLEATFFVSVGLVERDPEVVERLARMWGVGRGELEPLSWPQIAELLGAGMEVGSHTWGHTNLAQVDEDVATVELARSKDTLEQRLGRRVAAVAYPFGMPRRHFTRETVAIAARVGYSLGAIVLPRGVTTSDHPLALPRFPIGGEPVERLAAKVRGDIDWHGLVHERLPAPLSRALFPEDARN